MGNPNPARITDELWWFWEQVHQIEPSIVLAGIYASKSGYHGTRAENQSKWPGNYSIREAEDQGGPSDKAAAIDLTFPDAQRGDYSTISVYCRRLMASGKDRNDPRLDGLREWYGQTDADSHVEGWDCRHLREITSDSSHLWHIHLSWDRCNVANIDVMRAVLSVLGGETIEQWRAGGGGVSARPAPTPGPVGGTRVLRLTSPNMRGSDVAFVQRWIGPAQCGPADGVFGARTRAGVLWYQRLRHIGADGVVGPQTWRQMGVR